MGLFSSGSKYKYKAEGALASAKALTEQQSDIEFRRQLLSNIRQERLARAQLETGNYSDDFSSSSVAGATAMIDSSLAGESLYAYESSKRADQIQSYNEQAEYYNRKYQKAQKKKAITMSVVGMAAGALTGGALGAAGLIGGMTAASGAIAGSQIGQGIGQIASKTGQEQQGFKNLLGGIGFGYKSTVNNRLLEEYRTGNNTGGVVQTPEGYGKYETYGVNPATGGYIPNTYALWMLPQTQRNVISVLGGY
jgi:hypothetical protein